jgi:hypothetical protein
MSSDPRFPVVISLRRTGTASVKVELPLERDDVEATDAMEGVTDAGRRCTDVLQSLGCTRFSEAGTEVITLGREVGIDGSIFVVVDRLALLLVGASSYDTLWCSEFAGVVSSWAMEGDRDLFTEGSLRVESKGESRAVPANDSRVRERLLALTLRLTGPSSVFETVVTGVSLLESTECLSVCERALVEAASANANDLVFRSNSPFPRVAASVNTSGRRGTIGDVRGVSCCLDDILRPLLDFRDVADEPDVCRVAATG